MGGILVGRWEPTRGTHGGTEERKCWGPSASVPNSSQAPPLASETQKRDNTSCCECSCKLLPLSLTLRLSSDQRRNTSLSWGSYLAAITRCWQVNAASLWTSLGISWNFWWQQTTRWIISVSCFCVYVGGWGGKRGRLHRLLGWSLSLLMARWW